MPILDVEIVLKAGETLPPDLAGRIADSTGHIFDTGAGRTWVKIHPVLAENYAENDSPPGIFFPVFVSILKLQNPTPEAMQVETAALTKAIAKLCMRPDKNVHLIYLPPAAGRVAFGGQFVQT